MNVFPIFWLLLFFIFSCVMWIDRDCISRDRVEAMEIKRIHKCIFEVFWEKKMCLYFVDVMFILTESNRLSWRRRKKREMNTVLSRERCLALHISNIENPMIHHSIWLITRLVTCMQTHLSTFIHPMLSTLTTTMAVLLHRSSRAPLRYLNSWFCVNIHRYINAVKYLTH